MEEKELQALDGINYLAAKIYQGNKEKGFWDKERNVGELLMLVTSELGEAMEAHRKGDFAEKAKLLEDLHNGKDFALSFNAHVKDTFEDEIADAVIRLFDLSEGLHIDLAYHIGIKLKYNATRPRLHGKNY